MTYKARPIKAKIDVKPVCRC